MKKITLTLLLILLLLPLWGDDFHETRTDHYLIKSTLSSELSAQTGYILEQLYPLFLKLTGEPYKTLPLFRVIELESRENFDDYLNRVWNTQSQSYLLIRQGEAGYSEIVLYRTDGILNMGELTHLAVFQYLEACNSQTPFWLKEGLARYFEMVILREKGEPLIPFNQGAYDEFLNREKKISLKHLISLNEKEMIKESSLTYPECWAFTHYLMNTKGEASRIFWDYLFQVRSGRWDEWPPIESGLWEADYLAFMKELNPSSPIQAELKALFNKDYYTKALELIHESGEEDSWLGLYYKGLIHYERGLFEDSLKEFTRALEKGGPEGIMKYAMGLSHLELGRREQGIKLLKEARDLDASLIPAALSPLLE